MPGAEKKTILVAEDNRDVRFLLSDYLRRAGHEVLEAEDGAQAVDLSRQRRPDLIVMDLQMPGVDGIDATRRIREREEMRDVPVIALSAFGEWGMDLFLHIE